MKRQPNIDFTKCPIGLGMAALGRPGYITLGHGDDLSGGTSVEAMEAHAHAVLDAAWEAGIRYFDAARSYGRAEEFLGSWLRQRWLQPNEIMIGSKWGYTYTADWQISLPEGEKHEVKEHSLTVLERQFMESGSVLDDHLALYQIHSATLESGVLERYQVLSRLREMRNYGIKIGLSVSGPGQGETIARALEIEFDGELLFGAVQATWNLLEQSVAPALQAAHNAGLMVIVKEALANGRLTSRNATPEFAPILAQLSDVASELNTTVDGLAIAAAVNQPWSTIVLSGAARVEHLHSNLGALEVEGIEKTMQQILSVAEEPDEYWAKRSSLAWN